MTRRDAVRAVLAIASGSAVGVGIAYLIDHPEVAHELAHYALVIGFATTFAALVIKATHRLIAVYKLLDQAQARLEHIEDRLDRMEPKP